LFRRAGRLGLGCGSFTPQVILADNAFAMWTSVYRFRWTFGLSLAANKVGVCAMNPILFAMRRPVRTMMLGVALLSGGVFALNQADVVNVPPLPPQTYVYFGYISTGLMQIKDYLVHQFESHFKKDEEEHHGEHQKVVVTSPESMDLTVTQRYVCQIRSQRNIEVCAIESGYLDKILVSEGQSVKEGDVMFRIVPVLYKARLDAENAEAELARLEFINTEKLFKEKGVVSENEVKLFAARLAKAKAKADLAQAELNFTDVKARYDGIVDRLHEREGSLIKEGDILTTLSDNKVMWVYFNVPEAQYLEYMTSSAQDKQDQKIELVLANHEKFPFPGKIDPVHNIGAIEAQFNNETGNIAFRADFPNPDRLLRHGQTGTILVTRPLRNAIVIPQRATFEILDKRYVKVVGEDGVADQRLINVKHELEDIFVIDSHVDAKDKIGVGVNDKIVLEGVREVEVGAKVEYEFRKPEEALKNQKFHAE
jgi:membrane fusion protein (multidrug efflux system)